MEFINDECSSSHGEETLELSTNTMTQTTSLDLASISSLENLTLGEQKPVSINSFQALSFMPAKQRILTELKDLPNGMVCHIIKFLPGI